MRSAPAAVFTAAIVAFVLAVLLTDIFGGSAKRANAHSSDWTPYFTGGMMAGYVVSNLGNDHMLTESERERIRQEEIFRSEVRASLEKQLSLKQRTWKFLNSPLGLWVLSSIVVAILTWAFSHWQESTTQAAARKALIERLDTEISSRLRSGETMIATAQSKEQLYIAIIAVNGGSADIKFDFGVFPEFRTRSMQSMLWELRSAAERYGGSGHIESALSASVELHNLFINSLNILDNTRLAGQPVEESERESLKQLLSKFSKERWQR